MGIDAVKKQLCRYVERLQEGILEARRYVLSASDENVVECFIDGIDKQMESNLATLRSSRNLLQTE